MGKPFQKAILFFPLSAAGGKKKKIAFSLTGLKQGVHAFAEKEKDACLFNGRQGASGKGRFFNSWKEKKFPSRLKRIRAVVTSRQRGGSTKNRSALLVHGGRGQAEKRRELGGPTCGGEKGGVVFRLLSKSGNGCGWIKKSVSNRTSKVRLPGPKRAVVFFLGRQKMKRVTGGGAAKKNDVCAGLPEKMGKKGAVGFLVEKKAGVPVGGRGKEKDSPA